MPGDPKDMTQPYRHAQPGTPSASLRYNARCGRAFVLPRQAAYDACIADKGSFFERQAAIRARMTEWACRSKANPLLLPFTGLAERGLPPPGVARPPSSHNGWTASRPIQQARGGEAYWGGTAASGDIFRITAIRIGITSPTIRRPPGGRIFPIGTFRLTSDWTR